MRRRDVFTLGLAALSARTVLLTPALAQHKYPDRAIRLVIPFPPGGVNDAVGRPWADKMKSLLGTVVVDNVGGAGSVIGVTAVARAQPDGYTILVGNIGNQVIVPAASTRPSYDPLRDFDPIYRLVVTGLAFAVHPSLPVRNLNGLIEYAKANRGKLSYASSGVGTMNHLAGEMFKLLTGTPDIVHVPYRGAGPAINDLIGGQVPLMIAVVTGQLIELHNSGKLRILAVTTPGRLLGAPHIPTAIEAGLPDMNAQSFVGLFAPKGTPKPIIEQIAEATRTALADRDFQQILIAAGMEPDLHSTPDQTRRVIQDEIARWTPIVKAIGLKLD